MTPPYRDELESLRAENERLRAQLASRRRSHGWLAALLVVAEIGALLLLMPWLNAANDAKFATAALILVGIGIAAAVSAFGTRRSD